MAANFYSLTVKDVRIETPECVSIAFDIPPILQHAFTFVQGQNITIKKTIEGEELRRSYSICSSPIDNELRIAVKKIDNGKFSAWANRHIKKDDVLEVLPPSGKFNTPLQKENKKNYIAFAAGSGITPLMSIIKTTLYTETESSFTLIYGNQNRNNIIFKEQLDALKNIFINRFSVHYIFSKEKTDIALNYGRITAEKCELIFKHLIDIKHCDEVFLCGPEAMIFTIKEYLLKNGIPQNKIHFELFAAPGQSSLMNSNKKIIAQDEHKDKASIITIQLDGIVFDLKLAYNGESILDAAIKKGIDLPFACKSGVCASCRAKLIDGEAEMDTNYALEPEELKNNFILTCQAHPRSNKLTIDFDVK